MQFFPLSARLFGTRRENPLEFDVGVQPLQCTFDGILPTNGGGDGDGDDDDSKNIGMKMKILWNTWKCLGIH